MELTTVQEILLIILSTALVALLVLGIAIAVMVIRLITMLRLVAAKAEKLVESAEAVGDIFKKASGPLGLLRFVQGLIDVIAKHKKGKG